MSQQSQPLGSTAEGGRVEIGDIRSKLTEIETEVRGATEIESPSGHTTTMIVVGVAVVLVAAAFILGRRRGRRTSTWVEVRRL